MSATKLWKVTMLVFEAGFKVSNMKAVIIYLIIALVLLFLGVLYFGFFIEKEQNDHIDLGKTRFNKGLNYAENVSMIDFQNLSINSIESGLYECKYLTEIDTSILENLDISTALSNCDE